MGGTGFAAQPQLDTGAALRPRTSTRPSRTAVPRPEIAPAPVVASPPVDEPALVLTQGSPAAQQPDQLLTARGALSEPGRAGLPVVLALVALGCVSSWLVRVRRVRSATRR